jgi:Ran GTPase-activating protein (RanGAP) involved in mRNA processing and transport
VLIQLQAKVATTVLGGVEELVYTGMKWGPEEALLLAKAVALCERLRVLHLGGTKLGDAGVVAVVSALPRHAPLELLELSQTGAGDLAGKALAAALGGGLARLTLLALGFNELNEETWLDIVRAVRQRDKLTNLQLPECNISPMVAKELAKYVKGSAALKTLSLGGNELDEEAWLGIVRAVRQRDKLTYLGMRNNSPTVAKELAEYVKGSAALTSLELGGSEFDEEAWLGIVRAARQRDKLTNLQLYECNIGLTVAKEIAEYVKGSAALKMLVLYGNDDMGEEGKEAVREAAEGREQGLYRWW